MFKQGKMMNKKEKTNRRKINLPLSPFFSIPQSGYGRKGKGNRKISSLARIHIQQLICLPERGPLPVLADGAAMTRRLLISYLISRRTIPTQQIIPVFWDCLFGFAFVLFGESLPLSMCIVQQLITFRLRGDDD